MTTIAQYMDSCHTETSTPVANLIIRALFSVKRLDRCSGRAISVSALTAAAPDYDSGQPNCPIHVDLDGLASDLVFASKTNIEDLGTGQSATYGGLDLVEVEALNNIEAEAVDASIDKALISGNDPVIVSHDEAQAYHYQITIDTTDTDAYPVALENFRWRDTAPAEFDMDPDAEDDANGCDDREDEACDGVWVSAGTCTAQVSMPPGATRGNPFKLTPHHIDVSETTAEGSECVIDVYTKTDENPASAMGRKGPRADDQYEPTSCAEAFTLNDGVEVIDANTDETLFGPFDSLSVGCPAIEE